MAKRSCCCSTASNRRSNSFGCGSTNSADCILDGGDLSIEAAVLTGERGQCGRRQARKRLPAGGAVLRGRVRQPSCARQLKAPGSLLQRVAGASQHNAKAIAWSDRIQTWYAPLVLVIALIAAGTWWAEPMMAWQVFIGLILICCPCAFGLATPLALARSRPLGGTKNGFDEDAAIVDVLPTILNCLDKTGT